MSLWSYFPIIALADFKFTTTTSNEALNKEPESFPEEALSHFCFQDILFATQAIPLYSKTCRKRRRIVQQTFYTH
jgi:hypothetical protein